MQLDGQTALVTGAASGIGRATAERLADAGARVVVTDVDITGGEETADRIESDGGSATFHELDVRDRETFLSVVEAVDQKSGLDVLVNNAGVGHVPKPVEDITEAEREFVFDVNISGVWNGCAAALPTMKARGSGAIVNVASLAGVIGSPNLGAYSLSKGAVVNFTRTVAAEAGPHGVRANAVCPGFVEGGLGEQYFESFEDPEAARERSRRGYALRRLGELDEVADAIAFLASDAASFVTGESLMVDGGFSIQ
ncbi:SDR family NAD(P)-dependent oxidoreductase [Haloprofundus salinisoli]|uniref:SDR family NAD(P)-dependent oxidoreductase n=1 Tax=Haloprofundus salinisoli TaxID=2876193 RepID=UPI001CCDABBE|nr:SDR family oxidoreductase [Haloprofundus salinisoli]